MSRLTTLLGVFVAVFAVTLGVVAAAGLIVGDSQPEQADVQTEQWQLDNVAPDGAEEGGEIAMESDESNKTVLIHLGTQAAGGGGQIQLPLQGSDRAVTTGSPAGLERSVGALASTLAANGHEIDFYTQSTQQGSFGQGPSLSDDLSDADAFVTVEPTSLSSDERADVNTFAEEGGRVFVGADPGQARGVVELGSDIGIYQETGYLYNVAENDQNFLSIFAEPADSSSVTDGVDRVVFRGAAPIGQFEDTPAFTTEGAELTTTQQTGTFGVAAVEDNVAVVGDTSFLNPENAYRADNNVLIGNVADFLAEGNVSENPFQEPTGDGQPGSGGRTTPGGGFQPPSNTDADATAPDKSEDASTESSG